MAIKGAVRWKPDVYKSSLEATVLGLNASPDGGGAPTGTVVMTAQLVAYDDVDFGAGNPYRPGHRDTEDKLVILYEEPVMKALEVFAAMTAAQAQAEWEASLTAFRDRVLPAGPTLVKAIRAARLAPPVLIG